jgi:hypothetical protein
VSRSEAHDWVKDTCALSKGALDQMQAQSARLGRKRINAFSADKISASHKSCKAQSRKKQIGLIGY